MLTNIALYYYLIYTPLQFWPCEAQTHVAMRSFGLPQQGTTTGFFHDKGKAIIEIAHLDAYAQYSLLVHLSDCLRILRLKAVWVADIHRLKTSAHTLTPSLMRSSPISPTRKVFLE